MSVGYLLFWIFGLGLLTRLVSELWEKPRLWGWIAKYSISVAIGATAALTVGVELAGLLLAFFTFFLVAAPTLGFRRIHDAASAGEFTRAARISWGIRLLHPFDGAWEYVALFRWLAQRAGSGAPERTFRNPSVNALARLFDARQAHDPIALLAAARSPHCRSAAFEATPFAMARVQTLAAADHFEALITESAALERRRGRSWTGPRLVARCELFAMAGRPDLVAFLRAGALRGSRPIAIGFLAEADVMSQRRAAIEHLERKTRDEATFWPELYDPKPLAKFRGTRALLWILAGIFFLEIISGGSESEDTLYRLGAVFLDPGLPEGQAPWRFVAASWLHYGFLHCAMNALGLAALGPFVERRLGILRFLFLYAVTGPLSLLVAAWLYAGTRPEALLGASGAVLALVGATAALLLPTRRGAVRSPAARERLRAVAAIVAVQLVFDFSTPQVSSAAHMAGLALGFLLAICLRFLAPRREKSSPISTT